MCVCVCVCVHVCVYVYVCELHVLCMHVSVSCSVHACVYCVFNMYYTTKNLDGSNLLFTIQELSLLSKCYLHHTITTIFIPTNKEVKQGYGGLTGIAILLAEGKFSIFIM